MKKNKIILGVNSLLSGPHHDNGAFLFLGDKYVGINSERLDRIKYSCGYNYKDGKNNIRIAYSYDRAQACINYCLDYFGLKYSDLDLLVYLEGIPKDIERDFPEIKEKIGIFDHHLLHAYSTFYSSGFDDSAILVVDGQGKRIESNQDKMVIQSIYYGNIEKGIKKIKETSWDGKRRIGIGTMYEMITKLIGFSSEGTTMGLSSYSNIKNILGYNLLKNYEGNIFANNKFLEGVDGSKLKFLDKDLFLSKIKLSEEDLELDKIPYGFSSDLANQLQYETEENLLYLAKEAYKSTNSKNLSIAGGVGLNSVANSEILKHTGFENIFILPSTDDSGLALGAALYGRKISYGRNEDFRVKNFYFGKDYLYNEIKLILEKYKNYITFSESNNIFIDTAKIVFEGNVIGWFQGGSESGPRALGNRSILADPRSVLIRDKVNKIKKREWWRPLAPAILGEFVGDFFELIKNSESYKYMLLVTKVLENVKAIIPGVTHIDGTARIQIVNKIDNEKFYNLIYEFYKLSKIPILLNTSFNSAGEPIVETPEDALKMFLSSELDYLIIGDFIVSKEKLYNEFSFKKSIILNDKLYNSWKKDIKKYEDFLKNY